MEIGNEPKDPNEYEHAPAPEREWEPAKEPPKRLWEPEPAEPVKV